jgi:hypothetical protein
MAKILGPYDASRDEEENERVGNATKDMTEEDSFIRVKWSKRLTPCRRATSHASPSTCC